jgi:hypothetical protein
MTPEKQQVFISIVFEKLSEKEKIWLSDKIKIIQKTDTEKKFPYLFSFVSRFISSNALSWTENELNRLEYIYPGFLRNSWNNQDLARVIFMMTLSVTTNKSRIVSLFEIAEIQEQIALYKGLYLLRNAVSFKECYEEGIRTNIVSVFEAIVIGNPFAKAFLSEGAWNQLILKTLFLDRKLFKIQFVDEGINKNLANMLQDFVKERWAAGRNVSPEIWRMIYGYLRDDVKELINKREFVGLEGKAIACVVTLNKSLNTVAFWDEMGK